MSKALGTSASAPGFTLPAGFSVDASKVQGARGGKAAGSRKNSTSSAARAPRRSGFSFNDWRKAKQVVQVTAAVKAMDTHAWVRYIDEESGAPYFFNMETGETRWCSPVSTYAAPKFTLLGAAMVGVALQRKAQDDYQQEVQWIQAEWIAFEKKQQAELRAAIAALEAQLTDAQRDDVHQMLKAFATITSSEEKKDELNKQGEHTEELQRLWTEVETEIDCARGALDMERERQKDALQKKLAARQMAQLKAQMAQIEQSIVAKRQEAQAGLERARQKFDATKKAHDLALGLLRKTAAMHSKTTAAPGAAGEPVEAVPDHSAGLWVQMIDPASGYPYYFNSATQVVQWEQPEDYVPAVVEDAAAVDAAAHLAEEWVSQDQYAAEQAITAQLRAQLADLQQAAATATAASGADALAFFEELLADVEDATDENSEESIQKVAEATIAEHTQEKASLQVKLSNERERQKETQQATLEQRMQLRAAKRKLAEQKAKLVRAKRLIQTEANWRRRRPTAVQVAAKVGRAITRMRRLSAPTQGRH